jgi:hypothetical protein
MAAAGNCRVTRGHKPWEIAITAIKWTALRPTAEFRVNSLMIAAMQ